MAACRRRAVEILLLTAAVALNDVAVSAALVDGKPARLKVTKRGYVLVLAGKGRYALMLTLRPRLLGDGDRVSFRCPVRPVADAQFRLAHDRAGHRPHCDCPLFFRRSITC